MNKIFVVMPLITACSFASAMEQYQSPRQSSPRQLSQISPRDIITRPRTSSNPILRVKAQSKGSEMFLKEENIGQKSETASIVRQRSESDGK